jgi:hypothetical protein
MPFWESKKTFLYGRIPCHVADFTHNPPDCDCTTCDNVQMAKNELRINKTHINIKQKHVSLASAMRSGHNYINCPSVSTVEYTVHKIRLRRKRYTACLFSAN